MESRYAYSPWLAVVIMMPFMIIGFCCLPAWFIWFVFLTFVESTDSYSHHSRGLPSVVLAAIVVLALITFVVVSCLLACLLPSSCSVSSTLHSPSLLLLRAGLDHPGGTHMARPLRWMHILFLIMCLLKVPKVIIVSSPVTDNESPFRRLITQYCAQASLADFAGLCVCSF